jgi:hypothetical protein
MLTLVKSALIYSFNSLVNRVSKRNNQIGKSVVANLSATHNLETGLLSRLAETREW